MAENLAVTSNDGLSLDDPSNVILGELIIGCVNSEEKLGITEHQEKVETFRTENRTLIGKMHLQRIALVQTLKNKGVDIKVSVIFFNNWSWAITRLLFYSKPKNRNEVVAVVNSCADQELLIKVSFYMHFIYLDVKTDIYKLFLK